MKKIIRNWYLEALDLINILSYKLNDRENIKKFNLYNLDIMAHIRNKLLFASAIIINRLLEKDLEDRDNEEVIIIEVRELLKNIEVSSDFIQYTYDIQTLILKCYRLTKTLEIEKKNKKNKKSID